MSLTLHANGSSPSRSLNDPRSPLVQSQPLSAGDRVGEYVIVRQIGRGGMGCVYEARDDALNRTVALKTLPPGAVADPLTCEQVLSEARALAAVGNAHVVTVHRVGVWDGVPYLVMERLSGEPLSAVLERGPVPLIFALKVGREVASGLAAAHRAGLVHRDVKPDNIFLDARRDRAVLIDFGLVDPQLPAGFGIVGSPPYMPPEQVRGEPLDGRADLYALGATLYRAFTGRLPVPADSLATWRTGILSDDPPEPADRLNPTVPPPLARLLDRLLAKKRDDRPASAAEVEWALSDILRAVAGGSASGRPDRPTDAPPPRRRRRPPGWVGPAAVLVAAWLVGVGTAGRYRPAPVADPPSVVLQTPRPRTGPPVALFDGRSLAGWTSPDGRTDQWAVADGVLVGTPGERDQFLLSAREFSDFVLEFEFRWPEPGGHTSVLVRAKDDGPEQEATGRERLSGLELNLAHEVDPEAERLPALYASGGVYKVRGPRVFAPNKPIGEWNRVRVTHAGHRLTVEWNGTVTFDEDLSRHTNKAKEVPALTRTTGAIGLHTHGGQPIEFRNITVAEVEK